MPQDEFNASYLKLLAVIARRRMQRGEFIEALGLFDEGIEIATKMQHKTSLVRLLCDKIQLLRDRSPVFIDVIRDTTKRAIDVARGIETLDTRPFEVIVRNQEALALLWIGDIENAERAARNAEDFLISYGIDPPDIRREHPLELVKSMAWVHTELGLCEYVKGNFPEARALFRSAKDQFIETRHDDAIARIVGYEAVVYCREDKISYADAIVEKINIQRFQPWAWIFSGASIVYYYILFERLDIERSEESEELRKTQREFLPAESHPIVQWSDNLRRMIYHRKKQQYGKCIELAQEFLKWIVKSEESRDAFYLDWMRTTLSLVLRELGLVCLEQKDFDRAGKSLLGSIVYWVPICGPREDYALDLIEKCMITLEIDSISFSGWIASLDETTKKVTIELVDEESARAEHRASFWIGITEFLPNSPRP